VAPILSQAHKQSRSRGRAWAHLAIEAKQLADGGLSREQAESQARRQLGNRTLIMELTREAWGWAGLARFWQDFRYAARVLRRQPAFALAAVLSLALGIGATTAVFSICDTVFLRPLPYADAEQLVWVGITLPSLGGEFLLSPDYVAWRRDNHVFQQLAATQGSFSSTMILGGTEPAEVRVGGVSANFFDTFAVTPEFGRTFNEQEELPNGPKAILLTDQFWRDHFHARRDAIGSAITLDSQPYTVIGVLPRSFINPVDVKTEMFATLPVSPSASHGDRSMSLWAVYGRLKPAVTLTQARADVASLFAASKADAPRMLRGDNRPLVQPLREHRMGDVHTLLFVLMGAVGCFLIIACANVANLLLARWSAAAQELAVRAALGAGRARLSRQLFTEIALLIAASTVAAITLVAAALRTFVHFAAGELPRLSEVTIDFRVFGIALVVSLTTALIFGGLPILRAGRVDLLSVFQSAGRSSASGRHRFIRRALVAVEVALSVVLLSGAALLFQTLWHMQNDHLGFRPQHVLTVSIPLRGKSIDKSARDALASDVLTYLRRMPGTEAAALTQCTPLVAGNTVRIFARSDRPLPEAFHRGDNISVCGTGADYLKAAGTRLLQGRFFTADDFHHPGMVAVINEAAARAYFPGESAIGKQILGGPVGPWKTVVGVVADTKNQGLNRPATPEAFVNDTDPTANSDLVFLVRTLAGDDFVARSARDDLRAKHPGLFTKTETLDQAIGQLSATTRFNTVLLSTFAVIALLMALIGIYGVLAFSVAQRRQEIGIRMALGATRSGVVALVMKEGAVIVLVGALAGIAGALFLTRFLATLLYGVKPNDPATYGAVIISMALTAAAASFLPAHKAAALEPAVAVRHE
jgi:predicted permease